MHLVLPGQGNSIGAAPLHVLGQRLDAAVVLAELLAPVAADDPDLAIFRVEGKELAARADADVSEGPGVEVAVLGFGGIDDVQGVANGEDDLDGARQRVGGRYDVPRDDGLGGRYGEQPGARFGVGGDRDEVVVAEQRDEARVVEAAGDDAVLVRVLLALAWVRR